jgi:hypothetical protein
MVKDPRAKLCPNCGAVLPGAPETGQAPPVPGMQMQMQRPQRSGGSQVAQALLIVVLIIIGMGVLLFLGLLILCGIIGDGGGVH